MSIPNWWQFLLLAGATFRLWRLLTEDDILVRPRNYLLNLGDWRKDGDPIPAEYRAAWGEFISCPWCFGAWLSIVWWSSYKTWPHGSLVAAVPFALSAVVGVVGHLLSE